MSTTTSTRSSHYYVVLAREPASFFAEKCGNCRDSTTIFSANVVVAKISYQMLEVLSFCDGESP